MKCPLVLATLLMGSALFSVLAAPANPPITEGQHYLLVASPAPPADPHKVTVEEFFWYGCPHCYGLEPDLEAWRKQLPADVAFSYVPNSLGRPVGVIHEEAFFIARELGIEERIHMPLFDALNRDHMPLVTLDSIKQFFVQTANVKPADFDALSGSFMIDGDVRKADQEARDYKILGTPTLVVDGKYVTTYGLPGFKGKTTEAEANGALLATVSALVDKSRTERGLTRLTDAQPTKGKIPDRVAVASSPAKVSAH